MYIIAYPFGKVKKGSFIMNKIVKFEDTIIDVQIIDGTPMFELYAVGMALGQIRTAKGKNYAAKDRIDKNVKNAEIQPVVRNAQLYITESQIYDLMLETKTDKCRTFRKWLTNEVLPELNRTGSYTMPKQEDKQLTFEEYNYFDKKYNGEYVLSTMDVSALTNINTTTISWYARAHLNGGVDYYFISGDKLRAFKTENPKVSKLASGLTVFTKSGFEKICRAYNIKVDTPKVFIEEKKEKPAKEYAVVIGNPRIKFMIETVRKHMTAIDVLLEKYYRHNIEMSEMHALQRTLERMGLELGAEVANIACEKVGTTTTYKF